MVDLKFFTVWKTDFTVFQIVYVLLIFVHVIDS